jgi:tubby-related protein 1
MYFQDGGDTIAMIGEKQGSNRTANYHIFDMSRGAPGARLSKKSGNYMGKLRGGKSKTDYSLLSSSTMKEQVGAFVFDKISITKQLKEGQVPRKLHVLLPPLSSTSTAVPVNVNSDSDMITRHRTGLRTPGSVLTTKEPTFERGQYRLNFHGRVTTPSVKNFQVVHPDRPGEVLAQFGRVDDNKFHLDFRRPLNAFQAFGMALAQFNL